MQSSDCEFVFAHLGVRAGGARSLHARLPSLLALLPGAHVVGSFGGLFGLGNHELFVLLSAPAGNDTAFALRACLPADVRLLAARTLRATARPIDDAAFTRAGVYVFRLFGVAGADIDELVRLSRSAWATFETSADYRSEPMALFAPVEVAPANMTATERAPVSAEDDDGSAAADTSMLLITWYDNLSSWERSRTPHPDAAANFARRAALTSRTIAYCTQLLVDG